MRRFGLTIFILFYTVAVVALTMERTENWAAERAIGLKHSRSGGKNSFSESRKRSFHVYHSKLLEDGTGLVSSVVRYSDPPFSETALYHALFGFAPDPNGQKISSRAPPVLL
jgi:hypothetical protein